MTEPEHCSYLEDLSTRFLILVMAERNKSMEVDSLDGSNGNTQTSKEKRLVATPVAAGTSGEGLPYAPEGWPRPGDVWSWKVGRRKSARGHWLDRSLHPPRRLQSKSGFYSKLSLEQYIRKEFPAADIDAFFASFIWKVPSIGNIPGEDVERSSFTCVNPRNIDSNGGSKCEPTIGSGDCKAGNNMCSLRAKGRSYSLPLKACDICCSEIGFCRDCCCILCCKTVDWEYGGYSFVRCEARVDENFICGHVAHLDCALRAYMAGTVGGGIGLDAEYYCRRCDNKTDLLLHVSKLIKTCEFLGSQDDAEKILNLGLCIVRGSEKERARESQNCLAILMTKLKRGFDQGDIWKKEDNTSTPTAGDVHILGSEVTVLGAADVTRNNRSLNFMNDIEPSATKATDGRAQVPVYITSDRSNVSLEIEDKVDGVLQKLKKSQEAEYRHAEQKLCAQKDLILSLYQQQEAERSEPASTGTMPNASNSDHLPNNVLNRLDQIKHEEAKLQKMMKIANGFGKTPKAILKECFGFPINE
ncbi:uncharacterized protein M6B38_159330 [Iris pallida]|uniref:Oberon PHD finger domain-containing protein n=1 Tax=Iris pallida TaxID=29817 RepID=A0AAX6F0P9_IRIPA|nr:uncharacterized protein M6B38_159330 [Iris pallida]